MPWNINLLLHCDLIPELVSTAGRPIFLLTQCYCLKAVICGWLQWPRQQSLAAKLPISPHAFFQHTWKVPGPAADRQCCSEHAVVQHLRKLRLSYHWMDWTASKTKDMWYHVALNAHFLQQQHLQHLPRSPTQTTIPSRASYVPKSLESVFCFLLPFITAPTLLVSLP